MRTNKWLMAFAAVAATAQAASAAPIAVTAITPTLPANAGDSHVLTSVTINGQTLTDLTGATTASLVSPDFPIWRQNSAAPAGPMSATLGLAYNDGASNLDNNSTFQFGRTITASDYIFISDIAPNATSGDAVTFKLVDSGGAEIGDYTVSIASTNYGSVASSAGYVIPDGGPQDPDTDPDLLGSFVQVMVAFKLSDFTGTTGNLANATGIKLAKPSVTDTGWDPTVVGLAAVPEPGTAALGLGGGLYLLSRRRSAGR